jgi:dipeptide/tripeptide permease
MIAGLTAIEDVGSGPGDPLTSLGVYTTVFEKLAIVAIILGVVLLLLSPFLHKRMHGVH